MGVPINSVSLFGDLKEVFERFEEEDKRTDGYEGYENLKDSIREVMSIIDDHLVDVTFKETSPD